MRFISCKTPRVSPIISSHLRAELHTEPSRILCRLNFLPTQLNVAHLPFVPCLGNRHAHRAILPNEHQTLRNPSQLTTQPTARSLVRASSTAPTAAKQPSSPMPAIPQPRMTAFKRSATMKWATCASLRASCRRAPSSREVAGTGIRTTPAAQRHIWRSRPTLNGRAWHS